MPRTGVVDLQAEDVDLAIRWVPTGQVPAHATLLIDDVLAPALSPRLLQGRQLQHPAELAQWPLLDLDDGVPGAKRLNWSTWFDFAGAGAVEAAAGRLVFSFVDQAVQAAIRGQGVALVRSPFLQDCLASGDLVMPFATAAHALRLPACADPEPRGRAPAACAGLRRLAERAVRAGAPTGLNSSLRRSRHRQPHRRQPAQEQVGHHRCQRGMFERAFGLHPGEHPVDHAEQQHGHRRGQRGLLQLGPQRRHRGGEAGDDLALLVKDALAVGQRAETSRPR